MPILKRYWILIACLAAGVLVLFVPLSWVYPASQERLFQVQASSFEYSPAEISVNPGDLVTIDLLSTDVVHGLYVDGYDLEVVSDPGQTSRLSFVADKPGSFRLRCSVTCGALHPFMIGRLKVGSNLLLYRAIGLSFVAAIAGMVAFRPRKKI
jgi:plastocyanin